MKPPVKPAVEIHGLAPVVINGVEQPSDDLLLATGADARRIASDLAELRALRSKRIRPKVFRRRGSRFWQIRYPDGKGGWRDESTRSENRRDAQALADFRAYEASAGVLPSTATFEQIIDALVHDAEVRGRKVARPARAARALKAKLAGHRAEACDYAVWLKYAVDREKEVSRDTVHLELAIARRAYRLARTKGLVANVPEFPRIGGLHVRQGFIDVAQWARLCDHLGDDALRDAAEFAFLCAPDGSASALVGGCRARCRYYQLAQDQDWPPARHPLRLATRTRGDDRAARRGGRTAQARCGDLALGFLFRYGGRGPSRGIAAVRARRAQERRARVV